MCTKSVSGLSPPPPPLKTSVQCLGQLTPSRTIPASKTSSTTPWRTGTTSSSTASSWPAQRGSTSTSTTPKGKPLSSKPASPASWPWCSWWWSTARTPAGQAGTVGARCTWPPSPATQTSPSSCFSATGGVDEYSSRSFTKSSSSAVIGSKSSSRRNQTQNHKSCDTMWFGRSTRAAWETVQVAAFVARSCCIAFIEIQNVHKVCSIISFIPALATICKWEHHEMSKIMLQLICNKGNCIIPLICPTLEMNLRSSSFSFHSFQVSRWKYQRWKFFSYWLKRDSRRKLCFHWSKKDSFEIQEKGQYNGGKGVLHKCRFQKWL